MERPLEQKTLKRIFASRLFYLSILLIFISFVPFFLNLQNFPKIFFSEKPDSQFSHRPLASNNPHHSVSVQNILTLPEENIDVGIAALTFAKEIYPQIDVASYSAKIHTLAQKVRRLAGGTKDPDLRIRCLNTVLLQHEKFRGTRDLSIARGLDKYYLNRVLDTKQGNCASMPLLYIAVSQRLGWPVYLVHAPDHSFVRYVDPGLKEQNIETTSNGGYVSDEKYAKDFMVSEAGRKSGVYLRTLSHRELLGDLAAINGMALGQQGHPEKAVAYLEWATKLNSRNATAWSNLITAYKMTAKASNNPEPEKYFALAGEASKKRDQLGFVHPKNISPFASRKVY